MISVKHQPINGTISMVYHQGLIATKKLGVSAAGLGVIRND